MTSKLTIFTIATALLACVPGASRAAGKSPRKHPNAAHQHLVIDLRTKPADRGMCWVEMTPDPSRFLAKLRKGVYNTCPPNAHWNPDEDYLRAGEIVTAFVMRSDSTMYVVELQEHAIKEPDSAPKAVTLQTQQEQPDKPLPVEVILGQWGSSQYIDFKIKTTADKAEPLFYGTFAVHRFYRSNLVSGFAASSLHNREYGVKTIPGATDGTFYTVPEKGPVRMPQLHPYAGLDWYFRGEDFFPGKGHFLRPAFMIGYGLDEANSFFLGPNIETRFGLNLGCGVHIGHETFLAPGVSDGPNGTHLPDASKAAPTVNRIRGGLYVSLGFDLSVFKSIFGSGGALK
jgi:hypothetical protein